MDDTHWDLQALIESHAAADRSARARVRRLTAWILEDPTRPHSIDHLAEHAAVSPRTLSRLFRRETGTSPAKFVEHARLQLAQGLLERTGMHIASIASRSGFRNVERMRRAFRRVLGVCPRAYASSGCGTILR
jgi:transcriptional regulator GlxA family with amidase domain